MYAAKWLDPVLGVDIHIVLVPLPPPAPPPPVAGLPLPLPHPFIGFVFDPAGLAMGLAIGAVIGAVTGGGGGGPVFANGLPAANTGTAVKGIPHFPMPPGVMFAPFDVDATKRDAHGTLITGSKTVHVMGPSWSRTGSLVMSCSFPIPLPTSVCLAIPMGAPVLIGGPEAVDWLAAGMAVAAGLFKNVVRTKWFSDFLHSKFKIQPGSRWSKAICWVTGHPVDVMTGEVLTSQVDFEFSGPIPIKFERNYYSRSRYVGPLGQGWHHPLDAAVHEGQHRLTVRLPDGRECYHVPLAPGESVWNPIERYTLACSEHSYSLTTWQGIRYDFATVPGSIQSHPLSRIRDQCGNVVSLSYEAGLLREVIDTRGRVLRMTWTEGSRENRGKRLASIRIRRGQSFAKWIELVRFEYDGQGQLAAAFDTEDHAYRYAYRSGVLIKETLRSGLSFHFEYEWYDPDGWCVRTWGDDGIYDHVLTYDKLRHITVVEDSRGGKTVYQGNSLGLVSQRRDATGAVWRYEWDERCQKTADIDPLGQRTEYAYDERGNQTRVTRPDGVVIEQQYDQNNRPAKLRDGNGYVWQQQWDDRGLLARQITPLGAVRKYAYDARGNPVEFIDELGAVTQIKADDRGYIRAIVDPLGHVTRYEVDELGNIVSEEDPLQRRTDYRYDDKLRLISIRKPSGAQIQCRYDAADNLAEYRDEEGHLTSYAYWGLGEVAARHQPDGTTVRYLHDTEGDLIGVVNQRGETYYLKRDHVGRVTEEIDYWGQPRKYRYNAVGNLLASEDALGRVIQYETDPLGRLLKKVLPDQPPESFTYDGNGNLIATENAHCKVQRTFDAHGLLVEEHQNDFVLKNTYDKAGNRIRRHSAYGNTVEYRYDPLGRVTKILINGGEPITIERDAVGQPTVETLAPGLVRHYNYAIDGRVSQQVVRSYDALIVNRTYKYDGSGNLTWRTDSRWGTEQFHYDPIGRIRGHINPQGKLSHYLHDPHGDLLRPAHQGERTEPGWERVCHYEGATYRFDATGNLVEKKNKDGVLRLTWDASNRLTSSRQDNGPETVYIYDAEGRRISKQTNGQDVIFHWDNETLLSDKTHKNTVREFCYYPGTWEPLALISDKTVYIFSNDVNGSPSRLFDRNAEVAWAAQTNPLGGAGKVAETIDVPLRLQGQYYDCETSLSYNRHRYYDAVCESFISQDPLGLLAGENLYWYAPNVLVWIDPFGLTGVVYLRINPITGAEYVGQSKSMQAFLRRQAAHNSFLNKLSGGTGMKYNFHLLDSNITPGTLLDKAEESWIRAGGGPGTLENKRYQMNEQRYKAAGGCIGK